MSVLRSSTPDSYGRGPQKFPLDTHSQVGSMIVFQAIKVLPPDLISSTNLPINDSLGLKLVRYVNSSG